jgi:hypothetical protein
MQTSISITKWTLGILLFFNGCSAFALEIGAHQRLFGFYLGENISLSPYKSYGSVYLNFQRHARMRAIQPQQEHRLYQHLLRRLALPRFILVQTTLYPLAAASCFCETDHPALFNRCKVYPGLNWFKAISTGPEEPYALSLFLGNITLFSRGTPSAQEPRRIGSALAGVVFSAGHWHILDNIRIDDHWYEIELALTGRFQDQQKMKLSWDFRVGYKAHENPLAFDVAVLSLNRSHSDWQFKNWSLFKNSEFNTAFNFPVGDDARDRPVLTRIYFVFSKKYPITLLRRTWLLKLGAGFVHARIRRFDRDTREFEPWETGKFVWLIKPNIEF